MSADSNSIRTGSLTFWWALFGIVTVFTVVYLFAAVTDWIPKAVQQQRAVLDWDYAGFFNAFAYRVYEEGMWLLALLVLFDVLAVAICWRAAQGGRIGVLTALYTSLFFTVGTILTVADFRLQSQGRFEIAPGVWRAFGGEDAHVLTGMTVILALPLWLFIVRGVGVLVVHSMTKRDAVRSGEIE